MAPGLSRGNEVKTQPMHSRPRASAILMAAGKLNQKKKPSCRVDHTASFESLFDPMSNFEAQVFHVFPQSMIADSTWSNRFINLCCVSLNPPVYPAHLLVVCQRFSYFAHHPEQILKCEMSNTFLETKKTRIKQGSHLLTPL